MKNNFINIEDDLRIKWSGTTKIYYKNDFVHRENGPAIEWANGS